MANSVYDLDDVLVAPDADGHTFGAEFARIGYAGRREVGNRPFDSHSELHIEQGPVLDAENMDVGSYKLRGTVVGFFGETAHVGPTPMARRQNALAGAAYLIAAVNDLGWKYAAEDGKSTTTMFDCHPDLFGLIPSSVRVTIDFRHPDPATVEILHGEVEAAIAEPAERARVTAEVVKSWTFGTVPFDDNCIRLLKDSAADIGQPYREIESQAGHDACSISQVAPTAMTLTPCRGGIDHSVHEEIDLAKTLPGVNLLLNAVVRRANR